MGKRVALLSIVSLIVLSLLIVEAEPASAELPKPSVPEFTVKLINYSVIEVTIKNQTASHYNVRIKRQVSESWKEIYHCPKSQDFPDPYDYPRQSELDYTVLSFPVSDPAGDQVDVQVEAINGKWSRDLSQAFAPWVFTGETSGWSDTQTVTLPTPSPPPTPPPPPPELVGATLGVVIAVLVVSAVFLLIYKRNKPKQPQTKISQWQ